jgi:hypothetical protein
MLHMPASGEQVPLTQKWVPQSAFDWQVLIPHTPPAHAKSTVDVPGHWASLVHGFGSQCPLAAQASSGVQSDAEVHAGMQLPDFPFTGHVQPIAGAQTAEVAGVPASTRAQSASVLQGFTGIAQTPQPTIVPPGVHWKPEVQSAFVLQVAAASIGVPESIAQPTFDSVLCQLPPLHVAVTAHPYAHCNPGVLQPSFALGAVAGHPGALPPSAEAVEVDPPHAIASAERTVQATA